MKRWLVVGVIIALFLTVAVGVSADPIHVAGGPKALCSPIHVGGGPKALSSPIHVAGGPTIE